MFKNSTNELWATQQTIPTGPRKQIKGSEQLVACLKLAWEEALTPTQVEQNVSTEAQKAALQIWDIDAGCWKAQEALTYLVACALTGREQHLSNYRLWAISCLIHVTMEEWKAERPLWDPSRSTNKIWFSKRRSSREVNSYSMHHIQAGQGNFLRMLQSGA